MTQRLLAHSMILHATDLAVAPRSWSLPVMVYVASKITDEHTTLIPHDTAEASKSSYQPLDLLGASVVVALGAIYTPSGRERPRR
ncbi:hypothetical protein EV715DRAFT_298053 [Schizophyllum commune]